MSIKQYIENYVSENPKKTFLYSGDEEITFEAFNANINRRAHYFISSGIKKDDRIALYLPNCPEFLYVWFACAKIGAAMVPVNNAYKAKETRYILNHSESKMVITNAANLDLILYITHY